jgi:hypothetical protein
VVEPRSVSTTEGSSGARPSNELALLQRAHDLVRTDPARALRLTEEDARRFGSGPLTQEREVIAIEALAELNRTDEALARSAQFLQQFPSSLHRRRIEALADRLRTAQ